MSLMYEGEQKQGGGCGEEHAAERTQQDKLLANERVLRDVGMQRREEEVQQHTTRIKEQNGDD